MKSSNELNSLGELWKSVADSPLTERPRMDILRRKRMQTLYLVIEMTITAAGVMVGLVLLNTGQLPVALAVLLFSLFGGVIGWKTRSMNISVIGQSTSDYLDASHAICKARRNHNAGGLVMVLAGLGFYAFVLWQGAATLTAVDLAIAFGLAVAALFFCLRMHRAQHDLDFCQSQLSELDEEC